MLERALNFLTSLRLTVACLVLALGLVFFGTLAQVKWGLWIVQEKYFHSWFVFMEPGGWKIPVYPGGYLLGSILLVNLVAAHIKRFELSRKKIGIVTIHAGLILLLVGGLLTSLFQVESYMAIPEGERKNYSESGMISELAIVDITDAETDKVVVIPERMLANRKEIAHEALPFKLKVNHYFINSNPVLRPADGSSKLAFEPQRQALAMDEHNLPAANIEIVTDEGVKGPFSLSRWMTERQYRYKLEEVFAPQLGAGLTREPRFTYKGREYMLALRPERYYKPFYIELLDFTHERYKGTEIPKNFASRVRLISGETEENREVEIYMNNPLRYWGETYYQGGFEPGDTVTILQVVRNPTWLTPYIACALVGAGLLIQFLSHLVGFAKKRSK